MVCVLYFFSLSLAQRACTVYIINHLIFTQFFFFFFFAESMSVAEDCWLAPEQAEDREFRLDTLSLDMCLDIRGNSPGTETIHYNTPYIIKYIYNNIHNTRNYC